MPTIKVKDKGVWKSIGSAGGGLGAQPNWNQNDPTKEDYIKNRTHYVEDEKKVNIMPEITAGYPPVADFSNDFLLEENVLYTVSVNGVEYELIGQYFEPEDSMFIGNQYLLTGIDEGSDVPFAIITDTQGDAFFISPIFGVYDISISTSADSILADERLYLCWEDWPLYAEALEAGNSYKVIFDNNEYHFTAAENSDADAIIIGDMTQYPFEIWYAYGHMRLYSLTPGIHTVAMIDETNNLEIIYHQNTGACSQQEMISPYEIKEGQTYQITYGENIYSCIAKLLPGPYGDLYLGNPAYGYLWDEWFPPDVQSTGEPFFIECFSDYIRLVYNYGAMEKFAIETMESKAHTLDPKFLPEGIGYIKTVNGIILSEDRFDGFAVMQEPLYAISIPFEFEPVIDGEYTVRWDGVDYTVPCVFVSGVFCLGNTNYADRLSGGDIPFAIISPPGLEEVYFVTESTVESHTVAISGPVKVAHKMDKDCLPEDAVTSVNGMTGDVQIDSIGAEGWGNYAEVFNDGYPSYASGNYSHAEGYRTRSSGTYSHAEGGNTTASGDCSHAEGDYTTASGNCSHAEGSNARAFGYCSHAEGKATTASGDYSHAEGYYTDADSDYSHVQGTYNIIDSDGRYAHIVGNGKRDINTNETVLSNAHTLDWEGNAWFQGDVFVGGTSQDDADRLVKLSEIGNIGGGGGVASWNDLTDKPFQYKTVYYEWNEDTEYETSVDAPANDTYSKMVKISNDAPDSSFFLGKTVSVCYLYDGKENRRDITLSEELLAEALEGITYSLGDAAIVVMADSFTFDNGVTLTKGIWSMSEYLEDSSLRGLWWKVYDPAVQLDESVIPDTIARVAQIPKFSYGTEDLIAGESELATGKLYFVYE